MRNFFILIINFLMLAIFAQAQNVTLAWDANSETDIAGYYVYMSLIPGSGYTKVAQVDGAPASPQFTVTNLPAGNKCFVVSAFNTRQMESGFSNEVCTLIVLPPAPPKGLYIMSPVAYLIGKKIEQIVWQTSLPADSMIEYGTGINNMPYKVTDSKYVTDHDLVFSTGLSPSRIYYYKITSKTQDGKVATANGSFNTRANSGR